MRFSDFSIWYSMCENKRDTCVYQRVKKVLVHSHCTFHALFYFSHSVLLSFCHLKTPRWLVQSRSLLLLFSWPQLTQTGKLLYVSDLWTDRAWDLLSKSLEALWKSADKWTLEKEKKKELERQLLIIWKASRSVKPGASVAGDVFRARSHHLHVMQNVNKQQIVPGRPEWVKGS